AKARHPANARRIKPNSANGPNAKSYNVIDPPCSVKPHPTTPRRGLREAVSDLVGTVLHGLLNRKIESAPHAPAAAREQRGRRAATSLPAGKCREKSIRDRAEARANSYMPCKA